MKTLKDILYKVSLLAVKGDTETHINQLVFDSRKASPKSVFVALKGEQADGHLFIQKAIDLGASAVVCEVLPEILPENVQFVQVKNSAEALAIMAANFYDRPSEKLKLVGVTGTNGKTTTASILYELFQKLGYRVGLLSTIRYLINGEEFDASHTTPDVLTINEFLAKMLKAGCTHCFMEVSSHALVQHRVTGLDFDGAIFSNITHDHLDYHKTFAEYIKAKKLFFDRLKPQAFALVNKDDKNGMVMLQNCKAKQHSFALKTDADFKAKIHAHSFEGLALEIDAQTVWFRLIGEFNAYNLMGIYGAAVLLGEKPEDVLTALSECGTAKGRFEILISPKNTYAIVDYAHTPDALENVLKTIAQLRTQNEQLITVVGCGGNRDATKRPIMADIACRFSNTVILTSDNPRFEEPEAIIEEMKMGVKPQDFRKVKIEADRRKAIQMAFELAKPHDIILVAGKGHENYQEIKGVKYPFDDQEELKKLF